MVSIRIEERAQNEFNAVVSFDWSGEYSAKIADPFSPEEEKRLEWYFEEHLRFPFTDQVKARQAGESIKAYGETLFSQMFADRDAFAEYKMAARQGLDQLCLEILGSPEFHRTHWEALKDPDLPKPLCLYAPMVRRSRKPQTHPAGVAPSPTINLLIVTARPHVERDVGYRTITRPLVDALRAARLPVDIDIVRPGTYRALSTHLQHKGAGFYHVIHFDLHGALLSYEEFQKTGQAEQFVFRARYDRPDLPAYDGEKAFLFFEDESTPHGDDTERRADPAEASEVAERLLLPYRIPIVILNACQSGKQTGDAETSLAARLMQAGVQTVLGMAYSVTVSAAKAMMPKLYGALSEGEPLDRAILVARGELEAVKSRRAYYDQQIALEDWLLPVVYQHKPTNLALSEFTPQQREAWLREKQAQYRPRQPTYGFIGRDVDILRIEKRLLGADVGNILLVRGMGGAGKSTLLHHLGAWWQQTGLVERVFYFGWDEKAWTRQQILHAIASTLYDAGRFHGSFLPLGEDLQQEDMAETLGSRRHLLILDNLESITGSPLSVPNTLTSEEQTKLRDFLSRLRDGQTLVLLGSRGGEEWLAKATFGVNVHTLQGLDEEAASDLADRVLARHGAKARRAEPKFFELIMLLAGYPLALEVVLANLKTRPPAEVLAALEEGAVGLDAGGTDKTENILRCIDYSHGNLSPEAQELLACLAPFTGVFNKGWLETYTERLKAQPALKTVPFDRWPEVFAEAADWGLISPDPHRPQLLRLQPVFPYFLKTRLNEPARAAERAAIETAFRELYDQIGHVIYDMLTGKDPAQCQLGQVLADLEYANLAASLRFAVEQQVSVARIFGVLSFYLDLRHDHTRGLDLGEFVLKGLEKYSLEKQQGVLGLELGAQIDNIASRYLGLKRFNEAREAYEKALSLLSTVEGGSDELKAKLQGSTYHQLGRVAEEQRQWAQAEQYYKQALEIYIAFNDRYSQARAYHQLGRVAQEQRQWAQAEQYYKQALEIWIASNDRHSQASTYNNLGIVAQEQRQWAQAEQYYKQALEIKIAFNDRHSQAGTYYNLGIVAQEQRQWAQAEQYYKQALKIWIAFNDRHSQADIYHNLGIVAQEQRQWTQAEQYYKQALEIKIAFNDRFSQASTYHTLGVLAQEQRQWAQAEQYYKQALEIKTAFNDRFSQASTYHQLGRVAQEQRQWAQAEQYYKQALEIYIAFNDRFSQAITYHQLGRVAEEQRQWAQAEQYYKQALNIWIEFRGEGGTIGTFTIGTLRGLGRLWQESSNDQLLASVSNILKLEERKTEELLHYVLGIGARRNED